MPARTVVLLVLLAQPVLSQGPMGENIPLATDVDIEQLPEIAYDPELDRYLVIFEDFAFGTRGRFVGTDGVPQGGELDLVFDEGPSGIAFDPEERRYLVLTFFTDPATGEGVLEGHLFDPDATQVGTSFEVARGVLLEIKSQDVSFNPTSGRYLAVWQAGSPTSCCDVVGQLISGEGDLVGDAIPIGDAPGGQRRPTAAANTTSGGFAVAWQDCRANGQECGGTIDSPDVYVRGVSAAGVLSATEVRLTEFSTFSSDITYNPTRNEYLVTWSDQRAGPGILARRLDANLEPQGDDIVIAGQPTSHQQPVVIYDPRVARYLLIWRVFTGGASGIDLHGRYVSGTGDLLGEAFTVAGARDVQGFAEIAAGETTLFATWTDCRDGTATPFCDNSDIYGQLFASTAAGPCVPTAERLCLQGGRFAVEVDWLRFDGEMGLGRGVPGVVSPDSGLFYFFRPENWELMVKVLDNCA